MADANKKYDIVFIIDETGSMDNYVDKLENIATLIINDLQKNNIEYRLGLVGYTNHDRGGVKKYLFTENGSETDFTTNTGIFTTVMNSIISNWRDGGSEYGLEAIRDYAMPMVQDSENLKEFILITDEGYTESSSQSDTVVALLNDNNVRLDVIGETTEYSRQYESWKADSDGIAQDEWEPIANKTSIEGMSGQFYDINNFYAAFQELSDKLTGLDHIVVDLNEASDTGVFVIESGATDTTTAVFKAVVGADDTLVGSVNEDKVYVAEKDSIRQIITIPENWNITATDNNDALSVAGDNATIKGANGNDEFSIGQNVNNVTIADLNTKEDSLSFDKSIEPGTLNSTVENDQLKLYTDDELRSIILQDVPRLTNEVLNYSVSNGGDTNTIRELLSGVVEEIINPDATHRMSLANWSYGFTPSKDK